MAPPGFSSPTGLVEVGAIAGPRGLKGEVWIRTHTADPADVVAYGPLCDASGRTVFKVRVTEVDKDRVAARIEGVEDRTRAEALKGTRLFVPRAAFPEPGEEEYYLADLIGLRVETAAGEVLGAVLAVHDFGAGSLLEVERPAGPTVLAPFTRAVVPVVDLAGGRIVVDPPDGLFGTDDARGTDDET